MGRVPLVDKNELPDKYDILSEVSESLHEDMDAEWWQNQATLRTYGNNIELGKTHVATNVSLWTKNGLTPEETEYVILSVAKSLRSKYIWHDHVIAAFERSNMTAEQLLALAKDKTDKLAEEHQTLINYTQEFVENEGDVSNKSYDKLSNFYNNEQIVGATLTAAYYIFIEFTARALQIPFDKKFMGWELENYENI